jgi:hypothetical protein
VKYQFLRSEVPVHRVVGLVPLDLLVAVRLEIGANRLLGHRGRLDADELRRKAFDVEARKGGRLGPLDVHREEVDLLDSVLLEQLVEGNGGERHLLALEQHLLVGAGGLERAILLGRGQTFDPRSVEGIECVGVVGHEEGEEAAVRSLALPGGGVLGKCVDADPAPTEVLLQVVGGAADGWRATADIEEEASASIPEEVANDELLVELRVELLLRLEDAVGLVAAAGGAE